jgi:hypothetical protein
MSKERFLWWFVFVILAGVLILSFLGLFSLATIIAVNPEAAAFSIGFAGFWLFANRLIFGYGILANSAKAFLDGKELDKEKIAQKINQPIEKLEDIGIVSLLVMWKNSLEPFKYAYYLGFFLVFTIALLFEFNIISSITVAPIAKGLMFGSAIPTVIVWGLELTADCYLTKSLNKSAEDKQ